MWVRAILLAIIVFQLAVNGWLFNCLHKDRLRENNMSAAAAKMIDDMNAAFIEREADCSIYYVHTMSVLCTGHEWHYMQKDKI